MERVIVFGGTGSLGKVVVKEFKSRKCSVLAFGRDVVPSWPEEPHHVVYCQRDRDDEFGAGPLFVINTLSYLQNKYIKSVVIVSSITGSLVSTRCTASYHAAKAAMIQLARYYAMEFRGHRIRVNCVSPGHIGFNISRKQVAQVIVWLCSKQASGINGANIVVDGGSSIIQQGP